MITGAQTRTRRYQRTNRRFDCMNAENFEQDNKGSANGSASTKHPEVLLAGWHKFDCLKVVKNLLSRHFVAFFLHLFSCSLF